MTDVMTLSKDEVAARREKRTRGRPGLGLTYKEVRQAMDKGIEIVQVDGDETRLRRHHIPTKDLQELKKEAAEAGTFPNPYPKEGTYRAIVQSLINLSPDTWHSFDAMYNGVKEVMKEWKRDGNRTAWTYFMERSKEDAAERNKGVKKTTDRVSSERLARERILRNAMVLQRLGGANPYGNRLAQVSAAIQIVTDREHYYLKLKTFNRTIDVHNAAKKGELVLKPSEVPASEMNQEMTEDFKDILSE